MNYSLKNFLNTLACILFSTIFYGQHQTIERVEPPNWYIGMETQTLQLLVYGPQIAKSKISVNYNGVRLDSTSRVTSPNYLFLHLHIGKKTSPGNLILNFTDPSNVTTAYTYPLSNKRNYESTSQSITASDVMYLITPDRFANGNTSNDSTFSTLEKVDRKNDDGRHGGDIQGIINNSDYLSDLGVTTIWLNPTLENDQEKYSYHGYGISDFYKTDPRFGSNKKYLEFVAVFHKKGMKVIMDQVFNHIGAGHWWMKDLPTNNWLNQWESYTQTSFTNIIASDPHASEIDTNLFTRGWFDRNLPDLNLDNALLAQYMIQNSIWWVEYAQLDGIRMDTYPYPNKQVMDGWIQRMKLEYPMLYIVAETWESKASSLSYWNNRSMNNDGFTSHVTSVCDYPLYYAQLKAFGTEGKTYSLYETLAEDFVYGNAANNKIFNGNHDVGRLYSLLNNDIEKLQLSMAFTLTTRGIPQLYYGDELAFEGDKPDGQLRKDFPGGWDGDQRNAFTKEGRSTQENKLHTFVSRILKWRKSAVEIHHGTLTHYQPLNDVYVYFRHTETTSTMVILNNSKRFYADFNLTRFKENLTGFSRGTNIITQEKQQQLKHISLKANTAIILQLQK